MSYSQCNTLPYPSLDKILHYQRHATIRIKETSIFHLFYNKFKNNNKIGRIFRDTIPGSPAAQ